MSFELDLSDFKKNISNIEGLTPKLQKKAAVTAAQQLKIDSEEKEPKAPHREGPLRADVSITPINNEVVQLKYNVPYSKRWHNATGHVNWSEPGVGPEFVSSKMQTYSGDYYEIMGKVIEDGLSQGAE